VAAGYHGSAAQAGDNLAIRPLRGPVVGPARGWSASGRSQRVHLSQTRLARRWSASTAAGA